MEASRAHIELFRAWMEDRGLAASMIDRRLPTVCGFYRFAHIDGRSIRTRPVRPPGPKSTPPTLAAWTAPSLACSSSPPSITTGTTPRLPCYSASTGLRVSEACATDIEASASSAATAHFGSWARATSAPPSHSSAATHGRSTWPSVNVTKGRSCDAVTATARPAHRASVGPLDRETCQPRCRAPAHAVSSVHHGRPRRRGPAARRPDCRPPRRSQNDNHLRPATPELRPPRRLRRRRLRRRRLSTDRPNAAPRWHVSRRYVRTFGDACARGCPPRAVDRCVQGSGLVAAARRATIAE
jgi:hypothetical protein